ncbi:MAG: DinB family protein [Candidatus Angelobacter sp. Gp1-AA117]|nr:MAG: DinB family protein [Candidatus Angelobacter sp. Gp1-AA117]
MIGIPERTEAAPYYFTYIDRITTPDILGRLESQLDEVATFLRGISEEKSLYRYAPGKWSLREVLNHLNDCERMFVFRSFWFARGLDTALPSFDQDIAAAGAHADLIPWARHVEEFLQIRQATLPFFRNLSEDAWKRTGTASGNLFTVRALAYIAAGHVDHHVAILRERYLGKAPGA